MWIRGRAMWGLLLFHLVVLYEFCVEKKPNSMSSWSTRKLWNVFLFWLLLLFSNAMYLVLSSYSHISVEDNLLGKAPGILMLWLFCFFINITCVLCRVSVGYMLLWQSEPSNYVLIAKKTRRHNCHWSVGSKRSVLKYLRSRSSVQPCHMWESRGLSRRITCEEVTIGRIKRESHLAQYANYWSL